jgi:NAD(P)-dependent dehydrogenase (short-subunit alcohol dehydrogenase family)
MGLLERFRLDGKVAVVTGASSGIGAGIAAAFVEAGATVHAVARRADRLDELAAGLDGVVPRVVDLADTTATERLVTEVLADAGRIDVLVNNAGISNIARAQDERTADFRRIVDLNLTATFVLARDAGCAMIEQGDGGAIVNIASVTGMIGIGSPLPQAAYAASKGGCINLTRELAVQWARHGIRVNAIAPGWIDTEMTGDWLATDKGQETVQRLAPLRRAGTVDEIATTALFLAGDGASYVTGAVLAVDGGWTAS